MVDFPAIRYTSRYRFTAKISPAQEASPTMKIPRYNNFKGMNWSPSPHPCPSLEKKHHFLPTKKIHFTKNFYSSPVHPHFGSLHLEPCSRHSAASRMRPSQNSGHLVTCFHPEKSRLPFRVKSSTCNSQLVFFGKKNLSFQFFVASEKNGRFFHLPFSSEFPGDVGLDDFWESPSPRSSSLPTSNVNPRSTSWKKAFNFSPSLWKYEGSIWRILQIPTVFFYEFLDVPESEVTAMLAMIFCGLLKL